MKNRGQKRVWPKIEVWKSKYENLDFLELNKLKWVCAPITIIENHNWFLNDDLQKWNEPRRLTRLKMIEALTKIYKCWHFQLLKTDLDARLTLQLFNYNFHHSTVSCSIDFHKEYNLDFSGLKKSSSNKTFQAENYGRLANTLKQVTWQCYKEDKNIKSTPKIQETLKKLTKGNPPKKPKKAFEDTCWIGSFES